MALFVLGDPHLSLGASKPMDIFPGWNDYVDRLEKNWSKLITPQDTIVLAGDISWAMRLTDTRKDFAFLQQLPGQKIIMKGNHDYWWSTANKMNAYLKAEGFDTLHILHNNSYSVEGYAICGTRGWLFDVGEPHDEKVMKREIGRLRMSLQAAEPGLEKLVFLHYPPVYTGTSAPEGVRHQDLFLRASARQRHPVCRAGRGGRHPVQAGKCRRPAFLPLPHQLTAV
jgi:predicted phosphohydrolase